jgi:hypothetical protein
MGCAQSAEEAYAVPQGQQQHNGGATAVAQQAAKAGLAVVIWFPEAEGKMCVGHEPTAVSIGLHAFLTGVVQAFCWHSTGGSLS